MKKAILASYNALLTAGWWALALKMISNAYEQGADFHAIVQTNHKACGHLLTLLQRAACFELVLAATGVSPSSVSTVLGQIIARNSVILMAVPQAPATYSTLCEISTPPLSSCALSSLPMTVLTFTAVGSLISHLCGLGPH